MVTWVILIWSTIFELRSSIYESVSLKPPQFGTDTSLIRSSCTISPAPSPFLPLIFPYIHPYTIMFSKYSVLRQDSRNLAAEELEDSESAHMIHNGDKILYQPRYKRTQLIISLHWIGHGVSILVIIALLFCELPRRCNAPLASQRSPTVFSEDFRNSPLVKHSLTCITW